MKAMTLKKKIYTNYIVLADGSSIKKKSLKCYKQFELVKDNYNPVYISNLQNKNLLDLSTKTSISKFLNKYTSK